MISETTSPGRSAHATNTNPCKTIGAVESPAGSQVGRENPLSENTSDEAGEESSNDLSSISLTSTERYFGHIPFEVFKEKVYDVCLLYFSDRKHGGLRIKHIKGGTSNRIAGITVLPSESLNHAGTDVVRTAQYYIVRVGRYPPTHDEVHYDLAALWFAAEYINLPIPILQTASLSLDNPFGRPYSIQTQLPGLNAHEAFDYFNIYQRKAFLRQLMDVHTKIRAYTSKSAGLINTDTVIGAEDLTRFEIPPIEQNSSTMSRLPATWPQTTFEYIIETCSRWSRFLQEDVLGTQTVWVRFTKIAIHLYKLGFIPDTDEFHLCHLDLKPRNLLVYVPDAYTVQITGVLDWDSEYVFFCPKFMAYQAPSWNWISTARLAEKEVMAIVKPDHPDHVALKKMFEGTAGPEWLRYAYGREYMIARRMFRILLSGVSTDKQFKKAYNIIREWNSLHPELEVENISLKSPGDTDFSME
ncbi:hypothetical protein P153DRAFT_393813 [Dothidotthia symphoricarpi CBS 119687]|uniref:Aminoglycoside phosphotransferase domain-containing protein n=1 Tax=Dothidotthia symphoricarpi CBS 119687 TaxID=1392245 RepID=A0A6A6AP86_9PLEO|nr:uncharacterized protein P153DRAFT_393813 [Dothidotthia symphoricarpi CBS 119687]KAF2132865.1 hypothetical protein P153DRAFT_393813 [Dothidotthia symphoricarpi CBS 119687]